MCRYLCLIVMLSLSIQLTIMIEHFDSELVLLHLNSLARCESDKLSIKVRTTVCMNIVLIICDVDPIQTDSWYLSNLQNISL